MRKVYFQQEEEFMYCCDILFQREKSIDIVWERVTNLNNAMLLKQDTVTKETWIHCLLQVYFTFRLKRNIKEIIQSVYYYSEVTAIEQICDMTMKVLHDRYYVATIFPNENSLYQALFTLFNKELSHAKHIYFDALVLFRLKSLKASLIQAVGYAIDEIKQGEEHEAFIAKAREFVLNRPNESGIIYLLMQKETKLFQADGTVYSDYQLIESIQHTPLYMLQLENDEPFLAPIIALAPSEIHVYTSRPIEARVHQLCQIFKGKVKLYELDHFPFRTEVN